MREYGTTPNNSVANDLAKTIAMLRDAAIEIFDIPLSTCGQRINDLSDCDNYLALAKIELRDLVAALFVIECFEEPVKMRKRKKRPSIYRRLQHMEYRYFKSLCDFVAINKGSVPF